MNASDNGLNNRTSWANAYNKFDSIVACRRDTTIAARIADGTYQSPQVVSGAGFMTLNNELKVYRGFAGNETALSQRNWTTILTVVDDNIGIVGNSSDNTRILQFL